MKKFDIRKQSSNLFTIANIMGLKKKLLVFWHFVDKMTVWVEGSHSCCYTYARQIV